ncbi:MAG TPA: TonB family protein [Chthoniobacterales bacterium]|nr:TonB family protein [Chthoniobacterales bacterium]
MPRDARFWRNVTIIAVAHVAILFALVRWNRAASNANPASIVWMTPAEAMATSAPPQIPAEPAETPAPPAAATPAPPEKESEAMPANLKSDIQLPTPTPATTATPIREPSVTPTPVPKTSPKPVAKPTPKATPKKTVVVKATPSPKKQASPAENKKPTETAANQLEKKSDGAEPNGPANGAVRASEFAWYGRMLHDRFHNEWQQPTTIVATGAKMTAVVKIRIEKDGRVSSFTIVKPSGNVVVDESVAVIAKRVTQVDPLPKGLVSGDYYEVKINFELNPEQ